VKNSVKNWNIAVNPQLLNPFCLGLIKLQVFIFFTLACNSVVLSQSVFDFDSAPPPVKRMSKNEGQTLFAENSPKDRVNLALKFMDQRVSQAESLAKSGDYMGMYDQLGAFQAIMDDTLNYLLRQPQQKGNVLDALKKYEIGLRKLAPRIGVILRELPPNFDPYVRLLLKYIRDARSKAVEPLFGDTVVPNQDLSL
jgi:hypothetical protein